MTKECSNEQMTKARLTEEFGICLRFHPLPGFGGQVEASARQAEQ
jgi:hypothetical protein